MDHALSAHFEALGPDRHVRKANLQHLVSSLSLQEVRDLRDHLLAIDFRVDFIPKLPVELRVIIARYVDQDDLFTLLSVSKRWRATWTQVDVIREFSRRFLPGFVEWLVLQNERTATPQDLSHIFYETARRFHYRTQGKFRRGFSWPREPPKTDVTYAFDPARHHSRPDGTSATWEDFFQSTSLDHYEYRGFMDSHVPICGKCLYSNGRVVWQLSAQQHDAYFVVDDLRSRLRTVYSAPDHLSVMQGERLKLVGVGDTLFVARAGRKAYAWHLKTNQTERVTLPSLSMAHVQSHGNLICFAGSRADDIMLWTFGRRLQVLDTSQLKRDLARSSQPEPYVEYSFRFLFHPVHDHILFVVLKHSEGFAVYEYTQGSYSRAFQFDFDNVKIAPKFGQPGFPELPRQTNAYGEYAISIQPTHGGADECDEGLTVVCFNVLQTKFSVQHYPLLTHSNPGGPGPYKAYEHLSFWNGSLLSVYHNLGEVKDEGSEERHERLQCLEERRDRGPDSQWLSPLIATREWANVRKLSDGQIAIGSRADLSRLREAEPNQFGKYARAHDVWGSIDLPHDGGRLPPLASQDPALQFMLDFNTPNGHTIAVWEDDDFLVVLFDTAYTVWEFSESNQSE